MENVWAGQEADPVATEPTSEIVKCGDEAQVEASAHLLAHLGQMLNNPAFSDVEFVCNDGKRVLACRMLLAGRSDVLKSMFMNGMAESSLFEIALPDISSSVLLSVFEFLYTGTLSKHHPQNWRMACELTVASRFFLLSNLEKITRKVMHTLTSVVAQDLPKVASLLTTAVEVKALCDGTDVNLKELVTILSSNWSDAVFVQSLSEEAFRYLLENSKGDYAEDDKLSFTEYLRFRQVIRWCLYRRDEDTVEKLLNIIAPDEQRALSLCHASHVEEFGTLPKTSTLSNDSSPFHEDKEIRNLAIKLSSIIDWCKIHPVLLSKVVEPLNLISGEEILNSFRFHAVRRSMIFKRPECGWQFGESYSTLENGFVIEKHGIGIGIAVSKAGMSVSKAGKSRVHGVYQWRFVVEEFPVTFCELGLIYYGSGVRIEKPQLQGERLSDQHRSRVFISEGSEASVNWGGVNRGGSTGHLGRKVISTPYADPRTALFTVNASERTCSFNFPRQDGGVVWNNLPRAVYYPAVCLGTSKRGRVRIELVSGFDIL